MVMIQIEINRFWYHAEYMEAVLFKLGVKLVLAGCGSDVWGYW